VSRTRRARPLRIGHKGADAIAPGNTPASFEAAVVAGVDIIELDVLRPRSDFPRAEDWRGAPAGPGAPGSGPLLVAHDWGDAARREPLTLHETLELFTHSPLDEVGIDLDLKVAGREDEVIEALRHHRLMDRAMTSTMELGSVRELRRLAPELRVGWTVPRTTRDWPSIRWARPLLYAGVAGYRARLPGIVRRRAPVLGVSSIWAYRGIITAGLVSACHSIDVDLIAWTVDDPAEIEALLALGVDGICTNDPRLLAR
jgi:glycerophosphoryl diester phosphodiesterase